MPCVLRAPLPDRSRPAVARRERLGFTLLELVVVLVVLGLLAGVVGPRLFKRQGQATSASVKAQLEILAKALDQYRFDNGHYPATEEGLAALVLRPPQAPRWQGPYLSRAVPADPWGRAYRYQRQADGAGFRLQCLGADGQPGGSGDNEDIALP